jgi:hypothetical protein
MGLEMCSVAIRNFLISSKDTKAAIKICGFLGYGIIF